MMVGGNFRQCQCVRNSAHLSQNGDTHRHRRRIYISVPTHTTTPPHCHLKVVAKTVVSPDGLCGGNLLKLLFATGRDWVFCDPALKLQAHIVTLRLIVQAGTILPTLRLIVQAGGELPHSCCDSKKSHYMPSSPNDVKSTARHA